MLRLGMVGHSSSKSRRVGSINNLNINAQRLTLLILILFFENFSGGNSVLPVNVSSIKDEIIKFV